MKFKQLFLSVAVMSLLSLAVGCGGGGGGGSSDGSTGGSTGGSGTLSLLLQDAFSESYQAVYVTITEVQVCKGSNPNNDCDWQVVASPNKTYDLLKLRNGVREQLGLTDLAAGSYTQMRLILGKEADGTLNLLGQKHPFPNYVIDSVDNAIHELKVPSGFQTGIKIVHGFVIKEGENTELILDFDASKSVVRAGASGKWLLKPTVKVLETLSYSIVSGTVLGTGAAPAVAIVPVPTPAPLPGALVSAQQVANGNPEVIASTASDKDGKYALFLHPDKYNIVGLKIGPETNAGGQLLGYDPACVQITAEAGKTYPGTDLVLGGVKVTGTVAGTVLITGGTEEQFATLSFRKEVSCGSGSAVVEVKSLNLADAANYSEALTPGVYTVRASTADRFQEKTATVTAGAVITLDFELIE